MSDPQRDDTMQARMKRIRGDIDQGLVDVSASARNMVDWKHYRDKLAKACASLVRWCNDPLIAATIDPGQASAFREAVRRAEECLAASGDMKRFK